MATRPRENTTLKKALEDQINHAAGLKRAVPDKAKFPTRLLDRLPFRLPGVEQVAKRFFSTDEKKKNIHGTAHEYIQEGRTEQQFNRPYKPNLNTQSLNERDGASINYDVTSIRQFAKEQQKLLDPILSVTRYDPNSTARIYSQKLEEIYVICNNINWSMSHRDNKVAQAKIKKLDKLLQGIETFKKSNGGDHFGQNISSSLDDLKPQRGFTNKPEKHKDFDLKIETGHIKMMQSLPIIQDFVSNKRNISYEYGHEQRLDLIADSHSQQSSPKPVVSLFKPGAAGGVVTKAQREDNSERNILSAQHRLRR